MSQYSTADYAGFAKRGFAVGAALFLIGALGQALLTGIPAWEQTLLFDLEVLGLFVGLLSPLVFGIVLPLVE
jgi:hypothetical protein